MKIFIATVLIETENESLVYSKIVNESYDQDIFNTWIRKEIEAMASGYGYFDPEIEFIQIGKYQYSGSCTWRELSITIDICEKEYE